MNGKRGLSLIVLFMAAGMQVANSGEDRSYEKERLSMIQKIENILIAGGICSTGNECSVKKIFFVSPATNGIAIATYGVNDKQVLRQILEVSALEFYSHNKMQIKIEHFSFSKDEELNSFFRFGKPFVSINMERQ